MEQIMNYVKTELLVVAVVLYFCGMGLKQTQMIKDAHIPMILVPLASFFAQSGFWQPLR